MKGFGIYVQNDLLDPKHINAIGPALWLFMWCLDKITKIDEDGLGYVLGGSLVTIAKIQKEMGLSTGTISEQLKRLEENGYLRLTRTGRGFIIVVNKAKKKFKQVSENRKQVSDIRKQVSENPGSIYRQDNRQDILPKGNGETKGADVKQEYGNKQVNQLMEVFQKRWGYKPTDRYPRQQAWLLVKAMNKTIESYGKTPDDATWNRLATKYFDWISKQVWGEEVQTLSLVRLKYPIFESKIRGQA
jgi:DNA-binding MarR family transcriptional regulator